MKPIIEIDSINQVLEHIPSTTDIVFFDIDNTLIGAANGIHPTQWINGFEAYIRTIYTQKHNITVEQQNDIINQNLTDFINIMEPTLIENNALEVIKKLQEQHIHVIALTARPAPTAQATIKQLAHCGINFSDHAFNPKHFFINSFTRPIIFQDGVITCCNNPKGISAQHFFDITKFNPQSIVLIDDTLPFLEEAAEKFSDRSFVGLRYSYLDKQIKNFAFSSDYIPETLR